ncbi:hypothetical protein ACWIG4_30130 [Streptomyces sp. NPDC002248]
MKLKYTGTSHYRVLTAADAKRANPPVEGFSKTTWERYGEQEVSDPAGEWILQALPGEFVRVEDSPARSNQAPAKKS